ncbi:type II secretion system F family protein [Candidatus Uhrbacteria bacterium]|nr:type II secretion system F family protein [Candidatus Uhrbacteria bacterium]
MIILLNSICCAIIITWLGSFVAPRELKPRAVPYWPKLSAKKFSRIDLLVGWAGINNYQKKFALFIVTTLLSAWIFHTIAILFIAAVGLLFFVTLTLTQIKSRQKKFIKDLPDSIDALTKSLKAGYTLNEAFNLVAGEARNPIKQALEVVPLAQDYGLPFDQSLEKINRQINLPEWDLLTQALLLQERKGGNLVPILNNLSEAIRQTITIAQEARVATAAGRISAFIITATIPLLFLFLIFFNPSYLQIMFSSSLGQKLLIAAGMLQIIGFIIMKKISTVKN